MIQIAEMLPPTPTPLWRLVQQVGVNHAVTGLPFGDTSGEAPWSLAPMRRMKEAFDRAGFTVSVIESSPPMQKIRLGLPGRDEEIAWFQEMLRSMGALGIPTVCYNFMAQLGWLRTHMDLPGRGGALVTGYDHAVM